MKKLFPLIAVAITFILALSFAGCSNSPGSVDVPAMPSESDTDSMAGTWTGTWSTYSDSGAYGSIETMEFTEVENTNGSYTLSGSATISGIEGISEGTIEGTRSGTTVNFTVTFTEGPTMVYTGTLSYGSISGMYTLFEDAQESDSGSFFISKNS